MEFKEKIELLISIGQDKQKYNAERFKFSDLFFPYGNFNLALNSIELEKLDSERELYEQYDQSKFDLIQQSKDYLIKTYFKRNDTFFPPINEDNRLNYLFRNIQALESSLLQDGKISSTIFSLIKNHCDQYIQIASIVGLEKDKLNLFSERKDTILEKLNTIDTQKVATLIKDMEKFEADTNMLAKIFLEESRKSSTDFEVYKALFTKVQDKFYDEERPINRPENASWTVFKENIGLKEVIDETKKFIKDIRSALKDINVTLSHAEDFIENNKKSDISQFLSSKVESPHILMDMKFGNHTPIKELILFKDNSIVFNTQKEGWIFTENIKDVRKMVLSAIDSYIDNELKKKPTIAKFFKEVRKDNGLYEIPDVINAIETFSQHENILKSYKFNILDDKFKGENAELIDDAMHKVVREHKLKQYAHSITSNKYIDLYDKKSYTLFEALYDMGISKELVQDLIGKKIAAFKSTENFNNALENLYNNFNSFDRENILLKAEQNNIQVIEDDDNKIILKIKSFEQSKALGSSSWCISREKSYFNSYTNDGAHQYFVFDVGLSSTDNFSMVGITLCNDGTFYTAHAKNDNSIEENELINKIQGLILKNDSKAYKSIDEDLQEHFNLKKTVENKHQNRHTF